MKQNVITRESGSASWVAQEGDQYISCGVDRSGKRFSIRSTSWAHACCINIWRGSKWLLREGKRHLIQRINN